MSSHDSKLRCTLERFYSLKDIDRSLLQTNQTGYFHHPALFLMDYPFLSAIINVREVWMIKGTCIWQMSFSRKTITIFYLTLFQNGSSIRR